jgi:2,4-didehydro-3-deoxy-L-rhamnonate hydrolase
MSWYALATYQDGQAQKPGLVLDGQVFDLDAAASLAGADRAKPQSVDAAIRNWDGVGATLDRVAERADNARRAGALRPLGVKQLCAPFSPYRIFGAASNYIEHAAEMQTKLAAKKDSTPFIFLKSQSSVIGPGDEIALPPESKNVDWEVELGVVIGRKGRRVSADKARSLIAGYVVVNDISARDITKRTDFPFSHDWFRGKSFDTFTPMGPWFVPASCVADPHALSLQLSVNDEMMQDGKSSEMIFNTYEQIAYLTKLTALVPGDLLATGTPAGVGMGRGIFLKPGDVVTARIVGLGEITNPVVTEAA